MPDDPTPRSGVTGIIGQVLAYIDKPWKVIAVIALVLVGGAVWFVYDERELLLEAWLTPDSAELKTTEVPAALDKLIEESEADLIQVWVVDLSANSQRFLAARRKDGERPIIPSPRRLPVVVTTSDIESLVHVLAGRPACGDTETRHAPLMRRMSDRGYKRVCAVPIPPSSEAFVGVIYLAWSEPPSAADEDIAVAAAREISGTLIKK